ncbi:PHP domain-containing protein [Haloplanus natans]|uniref:PHP domain-containing protein n=1 Tax=Haloplanus natans TaxID=376171 RepID=UPI0006781D8D|nr:PHP domain-containing protein [Haloplanus natans]
MILDIDLQTHTRFSQECGWVPPETLIRRAKRVGLDGVAITDHNTMDGIDPARLAADDGFLIIPAEEIDTTEGQIIGLFLTEPIDPWQPPAEVLNTIHRQGGLALAPHPFDNLRDGLETIASHADHIDAVEVLNSRCIRDAYNARARTFAESHRLPMTGGSDAHFARELGRAYTRVAVRSPPDRDGSSQYHEPMLGAVRRAIEDGDIKPAGGRGTLAVHAGTKMVKLLNRLRNA